MTPERRADAAYVTAILIGVLFVVLLGPLDRRLEMVHSNDLSGFWSGGSALLHGVDPYDSAAYLAFTHEAQVKIPDADVYDYFPWVALGMVPLALLPLEVAGWIWMIGSMAAAALALRALLRRYLPGDPVAHAALGLALFAGQPGFHGIVLGQWGLLLMAAVATTILLLRARRPLGAALASLLFLAKPQVLLFTALGVAYGAVRERVFRRWVAFAAVLVVGAVVVSTLVMPSWIAAWTGDIPGRRLGRSAVLTSALGQLVGPEGRVVALALIVAGALVVAWRFRPGSDASLAAWTALSSAGALYSWSADYELLFVPVVLACGVLARRSPGAARRLALAAAAALLIAAPVLYAVAVARHDETFSVVLPLGVFVAVVALLWDADRRVAVRGGEALAPAG